MRPTNVLVTDAVQNGVSGVTGTPSSVSATPSPPAQTGSPSRTTAAASPGVGFACQSESRTGPNESSAGGRSVP